MLSISQESEQLIIDEEVGSKATYIKKYQRPEWPGGLSGVTIGIGYDVGYQTHDQVRGDWGGVLSSGMVEELELVTGLKNGAARNALSSVRGSVLVTWDQAMMVFDGVDRPRWIGITMKALPNCDKLAPDCLGALVSLSYNRGASYSMAGDRYAEMRAIKAHMEAGEFTKIPGEFRSMKRLWNNGLVGRREREAKLFERGLAIMSGSHTEATAPKVRTRSQEVTRSATQMGTATGTATGVGTGTSPKPSVAQGHEVMYVLAAIMIGAIVGTAVMLFVGRHQKMPKAD